MSKVTAGFRFPTDIQKLLDSLGSLPQPAKGPVFIVLSGLPGTGKSYFSRQIAPEIHGVLIEIDAMGKVLFHRPSYSWQESARLFKASYLLIDTPLRQKISLIQDATKLKERRRRKLYNIAVRAKAKLIMVRIVAAPALVR